MFFIERIREFARAEDGAATIDWVVLTAAISFVSITVIGSIQSGATEQANQIGAAVISQGSNALNPNAYPN
ncbi:MAG: hypothetical protein AAGB18_02595 [Pseudomonadota bacterium]